VVSYAKRLPLARCVLSRSWFFVALVSLGCAKAKPQAPQPPEVSVVTVQPTTVPAHFEYVGQAEASKSVEVRAQVSGVIVARPYIEGTDVPKGALLFRIDPTQYEAAYQSALAQLEDARARLANGERNFARLEPLLSEHAVAQKDVDDAQTERDQARAAVQSAQGAADRAKKDLDNTYVRAEIAGRAGRAQLVLGALVKGPTDLLTTVEQVDPIYVYFNPSDQDVLEWRQGIAAKQLEIPRGVLDVRATLSDGSVFSTIGKLNFVDLAVQQGTGTLQLRAEFRNPQHTLLPGQFVRIGLLGITRQGVIVVPQRSVQQGLDGAYVYVVDSTNGVHQRPIVGSAWNGQQWIVEKGLAAGERVIVDGTQQLMPGVPVRPVAYVPPPSDSATEATRDTVRFAPPGVPLQISHP
jgi:membrane fusion protein (multidrug efflux system)